MSTRKILIAPSILSADFRNLEREVKDAEAAGADRIHCDVMDGRFVPNISFGPMVVEAVKKSVSIPLDVHLMIDDPMRHLDDFCRAGADVLMFHAEAERDIPQAIDCIRNHGVRPGLTVNPEVSEKRIIEHIGIIDQALIMTVRAGFGGQSFIAAMLDKIVALGSASQKSGRPIDIEVDGGINEDTAGLCAKAGANVFVAGSFIFGHEPYSERISLLRSAALRGVQ